MIAEEFDVVVDDGSQVHAYRWTPEGAPRAIVQISHGMAEHSGRYERFANELVGQGYEVWAHDHRGHGKTASGKDDFGHFGDAGGFDALVRDLVAVRRRISSEASPDDPPPVALFAHSMGTFVAQAALSSHSPSPWAAVILSGSDAPGGASVAALRTVVKVERLRGGKRGRSALVDSVVFGPYNSGFKPTRTKSDWLSRDASEVDAFVADPLTGFRLTNQSWADFLATRIQVGRAGFADVAPRNLPILLIAGDRDPVGRRGAGVRRLAQQLRSAGMSNVEVTLYPGARHELINEINRDEVVADVIAFLARALRQ